VGGVNNVLEEGESS